MADLTAKDFSSLDTYNLYLGIKTAIENGTAAGTPKQTGRTLVADDEIEFTDKTKVSINLISGVVAVSVFDAEDESALLYTFNMDENSPVYNFEAFGNPINKILVQSELITDVAEVIFTNK